MLAEVKFWFHFK